MNTSIIEPGTRLAGRYRLDDRVSEAGGSTFWKATDEILARSVAVLTFAPGFPRVNDVVTAARAASRLTDPRLTQVFDADDGGERAYVVSEWVTGDTLDDLLAQGPMESDRAAAFLLEASEALTSAHGAGLAHLCLTPHNLVWTSSGTVKITGLGVEAVLSGSASDTPDLDDARGLGYMLYAALTGYWPGGEGTGLPAAPTGSDGRPLAPGQVRAGIPHNLDAIVCRTLDLPVRGGQEPLTSPAAFADAVSRVPRSPLPFVPLVGSTPPGVVQRPDTPDRTTALPTPPTSLPPTQTVPDSARLRHGSPPLPPAERGTRGMYGGDRRGSVSRSTVAAVAAVALVVVAIGGWGLSRLGGGDGGVRTRPTAGTTSPAGKSPRRLDPRKAEAFDPRGRDTSALRDTGNAIDGKASTYWTTQHYADAQYGKLQRGLGLLIDMGRSVTVDKITTYGPDGTPGIVEVRVGDSGDQQMRKVGTETGVGTKSLDANHAQGRYVLLWCTRLPNIGEFKFKVKDVEIYGTD